MKIPICFLIALTAGPLLGDTGSTGSSGGSSGATSRPQSIDSAAGVRSQGLSPRAATGGANAPAAGVTGSQPLGVTPAVEVPVTTPPVAGATGLTTPGARATQQGIPPADPGIPPLTNAPGGTLTNLLPQNIDQNQIVDPSGANVGQGTLGTRTSGGTSGRQTPTRFSTLRSDSAFGNQFRLSTGQNGTTQLSFPDQNAVVTIVSSDGNLTLQGAVTSEEQREVIEEAIRNIAGGSFIDNQIQVTSESNGNQ